MYQWSGLESNQLADRQFGAVYATLRIPLRLCVTGARATVTLCTAPQFLAVGSNHASGRVTGVGPHTATTNAMCCLRGMAGCSRCMYAASRVFTSRQLSSCSAMHGILGIFTATPNQYPSLTARTVGMGRIERPCKSRLSLRHAPQSPVSFTARRSKSARHRPPALPVDPRCWLAPNRTQPPVRPAAEQAERCG